MLRIWSNRLRSIGFNQVLLAMLLIGILAQGSQTFALKLEPDFRKPEDYTTNAKIEFTKNHSIDDWQSEQILTGPVLRNDNNVLSAVFQGHENHFRTIAPSTTGSKVPGTLSSRLLGGAYYDHSDQERVKGVMFSIGSASDKLFAGSDVNVISLTGVLKYPSRSPHRSWILMLNLSNDRPAFSTTPLPGVAYVMTNPEGSAYTIIGFPFIQVHSRRFRHIRFDATFFPWAMVAQGEYSFYDNLKGFIHVHWKPEVYFRHARADLSQRMFYEEKSISAGSRLHFMGNCFVSLSAGYSFNRSFYEGQSIFDIAGDRHAISDSFSITGALQIGL